jgi:hypothetical protein
MVWKKKRASIALLLLTLLLTMVMPMPVAAQDEIANTSDTTYVQRDLPEVIRLVLLINHDDEQREFL